MKKVIAIMLFAVLLVTCLCGCGREKEVALFGQSDNEILTYDRVDYSKTQIVVSRSGNLFFENTIAEFESLNEDIQVIYTDITGGGGGCTPYIDYLKNGDAPDILMLVGGSNVKSIASYIENISTSSYINKYSVSALSPYTIDGLVYAIPGPGDLTAIAYNKTMFAQYGWAVPSTVEEFIALCHKITEDTDGSIQNFNPNGKYSSNFMRAMLAFGYESLFGGIDNNAWYNDISNGVDGVGFEDHMEPFYEMIYDMIDAGVIQQKHFTYSATQRGNEFLDGKIAMANLETNFSFEHSDDEFGWFSFPGVTENTGYLERSNSFLACVPIKQRTQKQAEAVERFMSYLSTKQAQQTYAGSRPLISTLKGVVLDSEGFDTLVEDIEAGRTFNSINFAGGSWITNDKGGVVHEIMYRQIKDMVNKVIESSDDRLTAQELTQAFDVDLNRTIEDYQPSTSPTVGIAGEDFTILETSNYIADVFRQVADADIALVLNNGIQGGNVNKFYKGGITEIMLFYFAFRSVPNGSTLLKATVTGQQLLDILNDPLVSSGLGDAVYAFSGLRATVNPWNTSGSRVVNVTLDNGNPINVNATYTITYWEGTVKEEYITSTPIELEGTFQQIIIDNLELVGTIKPSKDGRMTLVWD